MLERTKHFGIISAYSYSEFKLISKGKSALAKYITTGLSILNETPEKIKTLEKSQDYFHIALQLNDDMQDWKEDYKNRNYSYLLTNIILENQLTEQAASDNPPDLETIGKALYLSKAAENQMNDAIKLFGKAAAFALHCPSWLEVIKEYQLQSEELKKQYINMRSKLLGRRNIQKEQISKLTKAKHESIQGNPVQKSITNAINYILTQRELNYPEMQHKMYFPKSEGFLGEKELLNGDVFQRTFVIDALIDSKSFIPNADKIIKQEVEVLVSLKLKNVRGGWSYAPELPELPPDSDDLAQVLQVLVKSNYELIEEEVSDPISLLINDCSYDDGTFECWIIDKKDTSQLSNSIRSFTEKKWMFQRGKDNGVQANILYGLFLYDYENLEDRIIKGVSLVEKRQTVEGYWDSNWYWGNYYGTYVSVRLIAAVKPGSPTLKKAEQYIVSNQNYDGGWGILGSDPLNTALALLTLSFLKPRKKRQYN